MGENVALWLRMLQRVKRARRVQEWEDYLSRQRGWTGTSASANALTFVAEIYL